VQQKGFSVILSDMCPLVSGITTKDAALSFELGMRALDLAVGKVASVCSSDGDSLDEERCGDPSGSDDGGLLRVGGHLVVKLLESEDAKGGFIFCRIKTTVCQLIWLHICYLMNFILIYLLQKSTRFVNHYFQSRCG